MPAPAIAAVSVETKSQFLEALSPENRRKVLAAATRRRYDAKTVVTNHGHPADKLFLLTKGLSRFFFISEGGKKLLFQWCGPGDLFGGRTILSSPSTYLLSTETVTDCSTLMWDRSTLMDLVAQYPRLLENTLLMASDFVSWQLTSYIGLACHTARQRVANTLVTLARTVGEEVPGGLALRITNEELANAANVTVFTASRLISEWQRDRALVKRRGKVLLLSRERMFLHLV